MSEKKILGNSISINRPSPDLMQDDPQKGSFVHNKEGFLEEAVNSALSKAKESGAFDGRDGKDGITPHIGANGHWYLGDADTGVKAVGDDGESGGETVPDYVVAEAMSVLDKAVSAQGSRTFMLGAITDMHYGSSDYTDGVLHACQGMHHIAKRIKLDAVAVLGDYTDEHQMDTETAVTDLEEMNALLDRFGSTVNLRLKGNHDHRPGAAAQTYRYIMAHSDDVVWGSRIGGYFYRDFPAYKLRVICLNTTEVARDNVSVSNEQYAFFVNALDLSAKGDCAEWGILILSHHPLDWTVTSGAYRFGNILNAYQSGGSWSDGTISCNYAGKNAAVIVCNIHGHIHNLLTDKIYVGEPGNSNKTSIWRMCVPASRVDWPNHYGGVWAETTTYGKTQNSAKDTAFNVVCIDLDARTIKAFCYGAGYDRAIEYKPATGGVAYTNQLPISTDENGAIYNGKGWKENTRIGSTGGETTQDGIGLTGFIPAGNNSAIRITSSVAVTSDYNNQSVALYDANKQFLYRLNWASLNTGKMLTINADGSIEYRLNAAYWTELAGKTVAYVRLSFPGINGDAIVTIDEPID